MFSTKNFEERNSEIKVAMKNANMRYWQLAELLGVSEATINRWLRITNLSEERKELIWKAIKSFEEM